jgi:small subunit ribosomal protein S7
MDPMVSKLTCMLTQDGKKSKAESIVQYAFISIREEFNLNPINVFLKALDNVKPLFELRNIRKSGKSQPIPALIKQDRQQGIALRWIVEATRAEKKSTKNRLKPFHVLLAKQLYEASIRKGEAFQKKQNVHKIGEANRAFAHSRWW